MKRRIWEIDFLRGIAIILMAIFHLVFDLKEFYSWGFDFPNVFWTGPQILVGTMFSTLSGISRSFTRNSLKQGLVTFGFGMLLTLVTYFVSPEIYIKFGILHFLGISMIIYHFMQKINTRYLLPLGGLIIVAGNILEKVNVFTPLLFPIGLMNKNFASLDYYPLLPWYGVFLIGVFIGRVVYKEKRSLFRFEIKNDFLSFLGRHSLFVYLTHQPLILSILYLMNLN